MPGTDGGEQEMQAWGWGREGAEVKGPHQLTKESGSHHRGREGLKGFDVARLTLQTPYSTSSLENALEEGERGDGGQ